MHKVILILGSNQGDRYKHLENAIDRISEKIGCIIQKSGIYTSPAFGYDSPNEYINQALEIETGIEPDHLLDITQSIEKEMGRTRSTSIRYTDRTIDIDILFYDKLKLSTKTLTIPHPEIEHREFVIRPLLEIIPDYIHPTTGQNITEMWDKLKKKSPQ